MTMMVRRMRRQHVAWPCDHGTGPAVREILYCDCQPCAPREAAEAIADRGWSAFGGIEARKRHRVSGSIMSSRGWPSGPAKQEGDILHPFGATPANLKHAWPTAVGSRGGQACLSLPGWEWPR